MDIGDGDVDFRDLHADEVLDGPVDGLAGVVRDLLKGVGILDDERDIDRNLGLADFHADALGQVFCPTFSRRLPSARAAPPPSA